VFPATSLRIGRLRCACTMDQFPHTVQCGVDLNLHNHRSSSLHFSILNYFIFPCAPVWLANTFVKRFMIGTVLECWYMWSDTNRMPGMRLIHRMKFSGRFPQDVYLCRFDTTPLGVGAAQAFRVCKYSHLCMKIRPIKSVLQKICAFLYISMSL
jgi:hypothetical protein